MYAARSLSHLPPRLRIRPRHHHQARRVCCCSLHCPFYPRGTELAYILQKKGEPLRYSFGNNTLLVLLSSTRCCRQSARARGLAVRSRQVDFKLSNQRLWKMFEENFHLFLEFRSFQEASYYRLYVRILVPSSSVSFFHSFILSFFLSFCFFFFELSLRLPSSSVRQ